MICNRIIFCSVVILLGIKVIHNNPKSFKIENKTLINDFNQNSISLIGTWNWRSNDKKNEFTIKIKKIVKDSLFAQYCAVSKNGAKLDCDFDEINNLKGVIKKNKIYLSFYSFFGAKKGKAEVEIFDNYLKWKITKYPKGEYYAPDVVTLRKVEDLYILKSCENSRFKILIEKKSSDYVYSILDKSKTILKGKAIINKTQIKLGKIEGTISNKSIIILNYETKMNQEPHFTQCAEKYLTFIKQ